MRRVLMGETILVLDGRKEQEEINWEESEGKAERKERRERQRDQSFQKNVVFPKITFEPSNLAFIFRIGCFYVKPRFRSQNSFYKCIQADLKGYFSIFQQLIGQNEPFLFSFGQNESLYCSLVNLTISKQFIGQKDI